MSTPTLDFSHLSIQGGMAQTPRDEDNISDSGVSNEDEGTLNEGDIEERKREMEDFFCSFQPDTLPSEWGQEAHRSERITLESSQSDVSGWTDSTDLQYTLLQWACYEPEGRMLAQYRRIKSPKERAFSFVEALRRRFDAAFERYETPNPEHPFGAAELAEELGTLIDEADNDRAWRVQERDRGWLSLADRRAHTQRLLNVLVSALRRATQLTSEPLRPSPPVTRSHRLSGDPDNILFYVLFIQGQANDFMLGSLERILDQGQGPMSVRPSPEDIRVIWQQLIQFRAQETYRTRFRRAFRINA